MPKLSTRQEEILAFIKTEVRKKVIHHLFVKLAKRLDSPLAPPFMVI